MDLRAVFDLHFAYAAMVILGIGLVLAFPVTKHFEDPRDKRRYYTMQIITAVCAVIGAKLAVVLGDALWPLREFHGWASLLESGRSIAGALLFGFLGAEAAKPLLRYDIPPNDRFALARRRSHTPGTGQLVDRVAVLPPAKVKAEVPRVGTLRPLPC